MSTWRQALGAPPGLAACGCTVDSISPRRVCPYVYSTLTRQPTCLLLSADGFTVLCVLLLAHAPLGGHNTALGTCASRPWLIPSLNPFQRTLLGFPAVDSPYWTEYTLNAVAERYGSALDMTPYREAFAARSPNLNVMKAVEAPILQTLSFRLTEKEGYDPASTVTSWHYQEAVRWTLPEPTLYSSLSDSWGRPKADCLAPIQVQQWREEGFLLVNGLIPPVRIRTYLAAQNYCLKLLPWQDLLEKAVAQAAKAYPPSSTSTDLLAARAPKNLWSYPFDGNEMMAFNDLPLTPGDY